MIPTAPPAAPAPVELRSTDFRSPVDFDRAVHYASQRMARDYLNGDKGWIDIEHDPARNVTRISVRRA